MLILAVMDHRSRVSALSALSDQSASTNPQMSDNDTERESTPISAFDPKHRRFIHEFEALMGTFKPERKFSEKFQPQNGTLAVQSFPHVMFINWPREITGHSIMSVGNKLKTAGTANNCVTDYPVQASQAHGRKFYFEVKENTALTSNIPSNHQTTILNTQDLDLFKSDAWRTVRGRYFEGPNKRGKAQGLEPSICPL